MDILDVPQMFGAKRQVRIVRRVLLVLTLIIGYYSYIAYASRISDKIYTVLQSNHFCGRRLNSTNQMGCTSELGGNIGVIWIVQDHNDIEHILKTGPTPPYVAILRRDYYTLQNLLEFKDNLDRVAGVVFIDDNSVPSKYDYSEPFSPESRCPNRHAGLYANDTLYKDCHPWLVQSKISGLLSEDIPYPIFLINQKESISHIEDCFFNNNIAKGSHKNQDSYPLCSMQLDSFMLAASDTPSCLNSHSSIEKYLPQPSSSRCYTVENQNIFAFYKPSFGALKPDKDPNYMVHDMAASQSIVLLITKLSSFSMFSDISPGADSTITSIVVMLAVADALAKVRNETQSDKNIAFAFLDSEPFGYTGSSSMTFRMKKGNFPFKPIRKKFITTDTIASRNVNLESLDYVINLDQLANYPNSSKLFLHTDPDNIKAGEKLKKVLDILKQTASKENIEFELTDSKETLPPTSVQEFIKHSQSLNDENKLLGLVLSNYKSEYENLFYNSIRDDINNINQTSTDKLVEHLAQVASFVAKSLYTLTFNVPDTSAIQVNQPQIKELLQCYLIDANCTLFTKVWRAGQSLPSGPIQTYKDPTTRSDDMNGAITSNLLSYFIGDKLTYLNPTRCLEENEKSSTYNYQYVNNQDEPIFDETSGVCVRSQVFMVEATSPAFSLSDDRIDVNQQFPAWAVSLNNIRNPVRIFMKSSPVRQWCVLLIGVVVTLIAFVAVYHIKGSISKLSEDSAIQSGTLT